jgi:Protein of unknown function (DUF2442)
MTTLVLERDPCAVRVDASESHLTVELDDRRTVSVPLDWYPRLVHATPAERQNCQIFGEGSAIEWPDIDEHISVEGLLAGRRSGESVASLERWLAARKR